MTTTTTTNNATVTPNVEGSTTNQTQQQQVNRDHVAKLIEVFNPNVGKDIDIPSGRRGGAPHITVKCDKTALDIVVKELKLRAAGKKTTLPSKDDPEFSRVNNRLTTLKKSVRMFIHLGVPADYLPKIDRQPQSSQAIVDVDAYITSV